MAETIDLGEPFPEELVETRDELLGRIDGMEAASGGSDADFYNVIRQRVANNSEGLRAYLEERNQLNP